MRRLTASQKTILLQWLQIVGGLAVFAFGVHLTIFANIGLAPWDCLGMGISYHTPLNYGLSMTTIAVLVLCIDLLLRERIGFGTVIDADFLQAKNGLDDRGDPVVYEFSGDDDLWVFLDGVLVLDIGGIHSAIDGDINFHTGEVKVYSGSATYTTTTIRQCFKDAGVFFNVGANSISYTENLFLKTSDFVRDWIQQVNGGAKNEQDFAFKYLYMPFYRQVQSGRCLFSYATSRQILSLPKDRVHDLDFRWICNDNKIQIEDDYVSVGIYAKSKNKAAAKKFIAWLMSEYMQKQILDRKAQMNLATNDFGIAGGFSALQSVTERLFPLYYRSLLSNTPVADRLCAPQKFPSDWARVKSAAVEPFILDSVGGSSGNYPTLSERYEALLASEGK